MWLEKTVYLENLGCAKNQVDAELMLCTLESNGWTVVPNPNEAELILVNTCGFIQSAKEESIQESLKFASVKPKVVMTGCLSQRYAESLADEMPEILGFFGNRDPVAIVEFLQERLINGERVWRPYTEHTSVLDRKSLQKIDSNLPIVYNTNRSKLLSSPGSAYVKISEGCKNRCTFCAIPLIRGDLRSRSMESLLDEIQNLLRTGIKEINLIAQDLNAYEYGLPELLRSISKIPGNFWLRPLYMYPESFLPEVIQIMKDDPRILPYFDIPFQHASSKILAAMGRMNSGEQYRELVSLIRNELPHAAIRTSILIGFPGETEEDFHELLEFQQTISLEWLGVFAYSIEDGTRAAQLKPKISAKTIKDRKNQIELAQGPLSADRLDRYIGTVCTVLIEEMVEGENLAIGRTYFQAPEVDGLTVLHTSGFSGQEFLEKLEPGTFIQARLVRRNGVDMEAYPIVKENMV